MTTIIAFIRRRPVPSYFALAFAISWGGILLLASALGFDILGRAGGSEAPSGGGCCRGGGADPTG